MGILLHQKYPQEIKNPEGVIVAVKLLPCGLPKEGPKQSAFATPLAIVYAANLFDNCGVDVEHWDWYYCPDPEARRFVEDYVRAADLTPNQWYYIDHFEEEEEHHG